MNVFSTVVASVVVAGCTLVTPGFLEGLLPLKGLLLRPCRPFLPPGLCLVATQLSESPPDPDEKASSEFPTDDGLTVGGEGIVCDSDVVSAVVEVME